MPKNLEMSFTTSNQYSELAKTMRSLGGNMALAAEAIERLTAELARTKEELVKEAARTAEQKLRADQMTQQHAMQAKMHAELQEHIVKYEKEARKQAIKDCADLLSRQHSWLTNVAAATLVLNMDNKCK